MGGMLAATLIGVFFTPVFYYCVTRLGDARRGKSKAAENGIEEGA